MTKRLDPAVRIDPKIHAILKDMRWEYKMTISEMVNLALMEYVAKRKKPTSF